MGSVRQMVAVCSRTNRAAWYRHTSLSWPYTAVPCQRQRQRTRSRTRYHCHTLFLILYDGIFAWSEQGRADDVAIPPVVCAGQERSLVQPHRQTAAGWLPTRAMRPIGSGGIAVRPRAVSVDEGTTERRRRSSSLGVRVLPAGVLSPPTREGARICRFSFSRWRLSRTPCCRYAGLPTLWARFSFP